MKLLEQSRETWRYHLHPIEVEILQDILGRFPFTHATPAIISRNQKDAKTVERAKLLEESLAEHRKELKQLAAEILQPTHWKTVANGQELALTTGSREVLLQILNDIRVGCWHALGQPDSLDKPATTKVEIACRSLMESAGYFEMGLLEG